MKTLSVWVASAAALAAGLAMGTAQAADANQVISTAPAAVATAATPGASTASGPELSAWGREDDDGSVQSGAGAEPPPRQVHGEVSAGFGSGGYAGVSGVADIPVGRSSDLLVAGSRQSYNDHGFRGSTQSLSVGLFLNGSAPRPTECGLPASTATPAMDSDAPSDGCNPDGSGWGHGD